MSSSDLELLRPSDALRAIPIVSEMIDAEYHLRSTAGISAAGMTEAPQKAKVALPPKLTVPQKPKDASKRPKEPVQNSPGADLLTVLLILGVLLLLYLLFA